MLKLVTAGAAVVVAGSLVGCVDAKKSFDDFADRSGVTDASTIDRPTSSIFDISGTFLLSVRAGFETSNDPAFYIQGIMTWVLTTNGDTGVVDGQWMPLCVSGACTTPRSMVPPSLDAIDRAVAADGSFTQPVVGTLLGLANPFSGTNQPMNGLLDGVIQSPDLVCGSVSGTAAGLDLVGSTWAAIRITDSTPANLPAPVARCPDAVTPDAGVPDAAVDAAVDAT